jgi:hypothetical protein
MKEKMKMKMKEIRFPCTACGLCCRSVGTAVDAARHLLTNLSPPMEQEYPIEVAEVREVAAFPYSFDKDGACEKLGADNRCTVYDARPDICNIEKTHALFYAHIPIRKHYKNTAQICNLAITKAGLDKKFLING